MLRFRYTSHRVYEKEREDESIRLGHYRRCRRIRYIYVVEVDPGYGALREDQHHVRSVLSLDEGQIALERQIVPVGHRRRLIHLLLIIAVISLVVHLFRGRTA